MCYENTEFEENSKTAEFSVFTAFNNFYSNNSIGKFISGFPV